MPVRKGYQRINIKLSDQMVNFLKCLQDKEDLNKSDVIQALLENFYEQVIAKQNRNSVK